MKLLVHAYAFCRTFIQPCASHKQTNALEQFLSSMQTCIGQGIWPPVSMPAAQSRRKQDCSEFVRVTNRVPARIG